MWYAYLSISFQSLSLSSSLKMMSIWQCGNPHFWNSMTSTIATVTPRTCLSLISHSRSVKCTLYTRETGSLLYSDPHLVWWFQGFHVFRGCLCTCVRLCNNGHSVLVILLHIALGLMLNEQGRATGVPGSWQCQLHCVGHTVQVTHQV